MATRIILIDKRYAEHWQYAKRNRFWDLLSDSRLLHPGDRVYFWVTDRPGHVVGSATVTSVPVRLPEGTPHAWSPQDQRRGRSTHRVSLADFEDLDARLRGGELMSRKGGPGRLTRVTIVPDADAAWLRVRVGAS